MSIQRIDNPKGRTHGWQARVHVTTKQRLTRFFSDSAHGGTRSAHGGTRSAHKLAEAAEVTLRRKARRMRLGG